MKRIVSMGIVLAVGCALGLWLARSEGFGGAAPTKGLPGAATPIAAVSGGTAPDDIVTGDGKHSRFAVLARQAAPGIVNVHTSKTVVQNAPFGGFPFGGLFGQLFGQQVPGGPQRGAPEPRSFTVPSLGTGFVISDDGLIVTNNHVVDGVEKIDIVFSDGTHLPGEVVGTDPKTDVALIRAKGERKYVPLPLGDSDDMLPGDWVVAIGNPFGLDHTVTAGIVSATGRDIGQGPYDDFIQTDAAINPGNSGGPLLNLSGQVVGINTAINPQANTIGFAVPINMAKAILPQLQEHGKVVRGWLGVAVQPITPDLADALHLETQEGALVAQVSPGGPAEKAGIERGDVIVRLGDTEIHRMRELPRAVAAAEPGTKIDVEVMRKGESKTLHVEIAEMAADQNAQASTPQPGDDQGSTAFGFDIADVPPAIQQRLGLTEHEGALITRVYPGGGGERAGLRPGDVIVEVDRDAVTGGLDAEQKLRKAGDNTLLVLRRDDTTFFAAVERKKD
jgi:serine protease Do